MNPDEYLKNKIKKHGAINIAEFIAETLFNPEFGYYQKSQPFGKKGDFVTAPEISQIFGELIGIWCADSWQRMGSPSNFILVEIGAGNGTLMQDLLRGTKHISGFHESFEVHMVEASYRLQQVQKERLSAYHPKIKWHEDISTLPQRNVIFVANELFDALPVHQYQKNASGWAERVVMLDGNGNFTFGLGAKVPFSDELTRQHADAKEGAIIEICPAANTIISGMATQIKQYGGAAVIIDYGYYEYSYKSSLQALKNHKYHNILADIGSADITTLVDFVSLAKAAEKTGVAAEKLITQRDFLINMGIAQRYEMLMKKASNEQQQELTSSTDRLINPDKMGSLFKVLVLRHN